MTGWQLSGLLLLATRGIDESRFHLLAKFGKAKVMEIKHFLLPPIFLIFYGAIEVNARCSRREFTICYPNGNKTCQKCPKCPAGHGLPIHCGSKVANGTSTECVPCVSNTYSLTHDSSTCRPCRDPCGGKKMLTECTATQNRKCDSTCLDPNYYLNSDNQCRECYFCCDTVSEGERLQQCKNIGMPRNKQCEKTTKNEQCKLASDPSTPHAPTTDEYVSTTDEYVSTTDGHVSTSDGHVSTTDGHVSTSDEHASTIDDDSIDGGSTLKDKDNKGHITTQAFLVAVACLVVICLGIIIIYISRGSIVCRRGTGLAPEDGVDDVYSRMPNDIPEDVKLDDFLFYGEDCILKRLDVYKSTAEKHWRNVASHYKFCRWFSNTDIGTIEQYCGNEGPTRALIAKLCTHNVSLKTFVDVLQELMRYDVANGIIKWYNNSRNANGEAQSSV